MKEMFVKNATDARKEWSELFDQAVRVKPQFIKRTRDYTVLANLNFLENLLEPYRFNAEEFIEDDGSVTLSLIEIDLVENGDTMENAKAKLAAAILEYSEDFYLDFNYWSAAPNRAKHIPYVFKALIANDPKEIGEWIQCQVGAI